MQDAAGGGPVGPETPVGLLSRHLGELPHRRHVAGGEARADEPVDEGGRELRAPDAGRVVEPESVAGGLDALKVRTSSYPSRPQSARRPSIGISFFPPTLMPLRSAT
jgi:hypothetical protein